MDTEWAQKLTKERVIKHIQDGVRKAYEALLAQQAIFSMNKSHTRHWQINKAYKLSQPKVEIILPCEIHQIATTIKLE